MHALTTATIFRIRDGPIPPFGAADLPSLWNNWFNKWHSIVTCYYLTLTQLSFPPVTSLHFPPALLVIMEHSTIPSCARQEEVQSNEADHRWTWPFAEQVYRSESSNDRDRMSMASCAMIVRTAYFISRSNTFTCPSWQPAYAVVVPFWIANDKTAPALTSNVCSRDGTPSIKLQS